MRLLLWVGLLTVIAMGLVLPLSYLWVASELPNLDSEYDIETHLRLAVEAERMSMELGKVERAAELVGFTRPDPTRLPRDLTSIYVTQLGCPTYFQTPRETGVRWLTRLFRHFVSDDQMAGDGWCERAIAEQLAQVILRARALGGREIGKAERVVAAHKIHSVLQKDQLLAYDLATMYFDRGVVGIESAARELFQQELQTLELWSLAELSLALPLNGWYAEVKQCRRTPELKLARNGIIRTLFDAGLVPRERAKDASSRPLSCIAAP